MDCHTNPDIFIFWLVQDTVWDSRSKIRSFLGTRHNGNVSFFVLFVACRNQKYRYWRVSNKITKDSLYMYNHMKCTCKICTLVHTNRCSKKQEQIWISCFLNTFCCRHHHRLLSSIPHRRIKRKQRSNQTVLHGNQYTGKKKKKRKANTYHVQWRTSRQEGQDWR